MHHHVQVTQSVPPLTDSPSQLAPLSCLRVSSRMIYTFLGNALPPLGCHDIKILIFVRPFLFFNKMCLLQELYIIPPSQDESAVSHNTDSCQLSQSMVRVFL